MKKITMTFVVMLCILLSGCNVLSGSDKSQVNSSGFVIPDYSVGVKVSSLKNFWADSDELRRRGTTLDVSMIFNSIVGAVVGRDGEVIQEIGIDMNSNWLDNYMILFYVGVKY